MSGEARLTPSIRVASDDVYEAERKEIGKLPWYTVLLGYWSPMRYVHKIKQVLIRAGAWRKASDKKNQERLAHEHLHYRGIPHPPILSLAYWFDLSGGFRIKVFTDRHDGMSKSSAWRIEATKQILEELEQLEE